MKSFGFVLLVLLAQPASATNSISTIQCVSTNSSFRGTVNVREPLITPEFLKNVVLGNNQVDDAPMPYPSDKVVSPEATDLQQIDLSGASGFPSVEQAFYLSINSKNFVTIRAFCTLVVTNTF